MTNDKAKDLKFMERFKNGDSSGFEDIVLESRGSRLALIPQFRAKTPVPAPDRGFMGISAIPNSVYLPIQVIPGFTERRGWRASDSNIIS